MRHDLVFRLAPLVSRPSLTLTLPLPRQTFLGASKAKRFLSSLLSLPCLQLSFSSSPSASAWQTIAQCAGMLGRLGAYEDHLLPLRCPPSQLASDLSNSLSAAQCEQLARATSRLEEIRKAVNQPTKRARQASGFLLAEGDLEAVRAELTMHGLLFDFPSVVQSSTA